MNRRSFFSVIGTGYLAMGGYFCQFFMPSQNVVHVKNGEAILNMPNHVFMLPSGPSNGDSVYVSVEPGSLMDNRESCIKSEDACVLGEKEELTLDGIANFKLTYNAQKNDWLIES